MFTLYHSNQLDLLKELLVSRVSSGRCSPGCWRTCRARAPTTRGPWAGTWWPFCPLCSADPPLRPSRPIWGAVTGRRRSRCGSGSSARRWRICSTSIWSTGRTGSPAGKRGKDW